MAAAALAMAVGVMTPLAQAQGSTIKIVSSLPRTGGSKVTTDASVNAIRQAFEEAKYTVGGFTIVYEDWDDASPTHGAWDAGKEAQNARKAVADPDVMVYLGPGNSGAARLAIPILNRAGLVIVNASSTYSGLTKPEFGELNEPDVYYPTGARNFVRVVPADDVQGAAAANWAKSMGASKVYVLDDGDLYGFGISAVFTETATAIGLNVVGGPESIDVTAPDYKTLATKIQQTDPDLVFFGGSHFSNAGTLFKDLRAVLRPDVKLMGPDGIRSQAFLDAAGAAAEGVYVTFGGIGPSQLTGKGADWYASYTAQYEAEPAIYAAYSYETAKVALDAIARAGRKDREAIRAAVFATSNYDGILGTWSFDENGDTTLTTMSGRQVVNGRFDEDNAVVLSTE
jgi:branched-chain amino acid transport system substrate-binding protein